MENDVLKRDFIVCLYAPLLTDPIKIRIQIIPIEFTHKYENGRVLYPQQNIDFCTVYSDIRELALILYVQY